ncbi:MAG: transglutaminaseTgpA domain-containing protein [Actinomycetota bacterium]
MRRLLGPSAALAGLAVAAIAGYGRVFSGGGWFVPTVAAGVLPLLLAMLLRRSGIWRTATAMVCVIAGVWFLVLVLVPHAARWTFPTREAIAVLWTMAARGLARARVLPAPVSPDADLLLLLLAGAWLVGTGSGLLGTGTASLCAAVPWLAMFGFAGAVGRGPSRGPGLALFLVALLVFMYVDARTAGGPSPPQAGPVTRPPPALSLESGAGTPPPRRAALALGAVTVAGALVIPGLLPGGLAQPGLPTGGSGSSDRVALSPYVQIRPRLRATPARALFSVEADAPAYWRLTAFEQFDGAVWKGRAGRPRVVLPPSPGTPGVAMRTLRQRYRIQGLVGPWLPAAFELVRASGIGSSYDRGSATLSSSGLPRGVEYVAVSRVTTPTAEVLRDAPAARVSPDYLRLPLATASRIAPIARAVAGSAPTAFDQAVALQSYLRSFTYDEDVASPRSQNALVEFLTITRAGYCEQFAAGMAVMLRTLGIPSRVAVGFLPGERRGRTYTVSTREAHAWPEAFFEGVGWVAFEPTPRPRVAPPSYALPVAGPAAAGTGGVDTPAASPAAAATPTVGDEAAAGDSTSRAGRGRARTGGPPLALVGTIGLLAALIAVRETRVRKGLLRRTASGRVRGAFEEFELRAADAVGPRRRAQTESEYAGVVAARLQLDPGQVRPLLAAYLAAAYSRRDVGPADVAVSFRSLRTLRWQLLRRAGWWGRLKMLLSPRPLLPARRLTGPSMPARVSGEQSTSRR